MTDSNGELNEEKIKQIEAVSNSAANNPQNNTKKAEVIKKVNPNASGADVVGANIAPSKVTAPKDSKEFIPQKTAKKITTRSIQPQENEKKVIDNTTDKAHAISKTTIKPTHDDSKDEEQPEARFSVSSKDVENKESKKSVEEPEDVSIPNDDEIDEDKPDDIDTQIDDEIDSMVNNDDQVDPEEVETQVKQKILITQFKPDVSDADQKRISEYMGTQNEIIKQSVDENQDYPFGKSWQSYQYFE